MQKSPHYYGKQLGIGATLLHRLSPWYTGPGMVKAYISIFWKLGKPATVQPTLTTTKARPAQTREPVPLPRASLNVLPVAASLTLRGFSSAGRTGKPSGSGTMQDRLRLSPATALASCLPPGLHPCRATLCSAHPTVFSPVACAMRLLRAPTT